MPTSPWFSLRSSRPAKSQSTPEAAAEPDCHGEAPLDGQGEVCFANPCLRALEFTPACCLYNVQWAWEREGSPSSVGALPPPLLTPQPGASTVCRFPHTSAPHNRGTRFGRTLMWGVTPRAESVSGSRIQAIRLVVGAPTCSAHLTLACSPACLKNLRSMLPQPKPPCRWH